MTRWYRVFRLRSPVGFWESAVYTAVAWLGLVGVGLLVLVPLLFLGCGPDLCGFFG